MCFAGAPFSVSLLDILIELMRLRGLERIARACAAPPRLQFGSLSLFCCSSLPRRAGTNRRMWKWLLFRSERTDLRALFLNTWRIARSRRELAFETVEEAVRFVAIR